MCFILKQKTPHNFNYIYPPLYLEYGDMDYIKASPVTVAIFETFGTHQYEHLYNEPKLC